MNMKWLVLETLIWISRHCFISTAASPVTVTEEATKQQLKPSTTTWYDSLELFVFIVENLTTFKYWQFWILVKTATLQKAIPRTIAKFVATKAVTTKGGRVLLVNMACTLGLLPKRQHHFGQNGHTLKYLLKRPHAFGQNSHMWQDHHEKG